MKSFIERIGNNELTGKDVAVLSVLIAAFIVVAGLLLKSMGVSIPSH